jgi:hypothetical protein
MVKTITVQITADQYKIMWCAYHVLVCALFPVQGGTWTGCGLSWAVFVIITSSKRGFVLPTCCLVISTFCWWNAFIYSSSQQFMRVPFWHAFSNCSVFSFIPYSCLFSNMCVTFACYMYYISICIFHLDSCKLAFFCGVLLY